MAKEIFKLQNFTVTNLSKYEGTVKSGDRAGSPYVKFVFKTDHPKAGDQEFQYFANPEASETWPYEGVAVKEMEGVLGTYQGKTQYDVKKLFYHQEAREGTAELPDKEQSKKINDSGKNSPIWFCMAYSKDLQVARLIHLKPLISTEKLPTLSELLDEVVQGGILMYRDVIKNLERG